MRTFQIAQGYADPAIPSISRRKWIDLTPPEARERSLEDLVPGSSIGKKRTRARIVGMAFLLEAIGKHDGVSEG